MELTRFGGALLSIQRRPRHAPHPPEELAQEFEPSEVTIRTWIAQAAVDERAGAAPRAERTGALTTAEREELGRLRREVRQLKVERDILGKAAAWFARETGTLPSASGS